MVVSHKIITLVVKYKRIWRNNVPRRFVKLFVNAVFIIGIFNLLCICYGLVNDFYVIKKRKVVGFAPIVYRVNIFYVCFKILV